MLFVANNEPLWTYNYGWQQAPLVGPAIDRAKGGRRNMVILSAGLRALIMVRRHAAFALRAEAYVDATAELVTCIDYDQDLAVRRDALRAGREGTVLLEMLVTAAGGVDSVFVLEGIDPELDAAAATAASQCMFSPAVVAGEPVPVYL